MKKTLLFKSITFVFFFLFGIGVMNAQVLLEENFDYSVGSLLSANGWTAHSGAGTLPLTVTTGSISYPNYLSSEVGNEVLTTGSGEDAHKTFTAQSSGSVYASVLVNIVSKNTTEDYFFHLGTNVLGSTFRGRLFVKNDGSGNLAFGISRGSTTTSLINYSAQTYALNTTYLIVMKWTIVDGTANDIAAIYINPTTNTAEPTTGWIESLATETTSDPTDIGSVAIRQGTNTPSAKIDGIRVGKTWADVTPPKPATTDVTFNVDMNNVAGFVPGTDLVYLSGSMVGWAEPGTNANYLMTDPDSDKIYTKTLSLATPVGEITYKYFKGAGWSGGEWNGDPNRKATITQATTLNDVFGKYIYNVDLGATTFYAGDNVTFTWASKGVDNVKIEVWLPGESTWMELIASTPSDGTEPFEIPVNADSEVGLIIRISDVTNSNVFAVSAAFELIGTPTIFDIQYDVEDGTDISWFKGQKVRTSGVVTAIAGANFWLQMPNNLKLSVYPEWSGILCYHTATAAALTVGDNVTLIATVDEYYGATELVNVVSYVINSQGNVINPTNVTAFDATEAYESTLITIIDAKVHTTPDTYGEFKINDGTADYIIDDKMYSYTPTVGDILSITGITTYANSNFKLYPRSANDVVVSSGVGIEDLTEAEISIYPNPSNGKFFVQMGSAFKANTKIEIFNVVGMKVFETLSNDFKTEIDLRSMKQGVYYLRVDDGVTVHTQKIMKQ
jgi:hypothetical protein